MMRTIVRVVTAAVCGTGFVACTVQASGPSVECRTVEVRNRRDVEVCVSRCGEEGCRTHCRERERWAREHRCWVD
jgi:hypothetical protein